MAEKLTLNSNHLLTP